MQTVALRVAIGRREEEESTKTKTCQTCASTSEGTFWSPCGRRNEVVGGPRRLLVTSRTSSWVVPPPKVVFYRGG